MKDFRDIALNEAAQSQLKKISIIASEIKNLEGYQTLVRNVKSYMEQPPDISVYKLEKAFIAVKSEIDIFMASIIDLKKKVSSKVIDEIEVIVQNLNKTLQYSYTHKTKNR